jgi:uncharacterized protein DUF3179
MGLVLVVLIALAVVLIPAWIIRPFQPQSPRGLELSYILRGHSQIVTLIAFALALLLVIWLWLHTRRWWTKVILVLALAFSLTSTWFARQNHFEWMFNPLTNAGYAKVDEASFANDTDMVLAVENNGDAVAYPVRLLAYHHVVQDYVGGTPIVATY